MSDFEVLDDIFSGHITEGEKLQKVSTGYRFIEGPIWHPYEKHLIFSDIKGNALYKMDENETVSLLKENSYLANGNTYDQKGNRLTCEHGSSRLTMTTPEGEYSILAESYKGKALNSPNDVVVKSDGSIYFTDPASGRSEGFGIPRPQELDFQGVFRLDPATEELTLLADDYVLPNGLCFSPDEKQLYVNDTIKQNIRVYDVNDRGLLENERLFAEMLIDGEGKADGMKFDSAGLLFCTAPRGIQVFNQEGRLVGRIFVPEQVGNFSWGGEDLKTLYITAKSTLYKIRMNVPGTALF